MGNVFVDWLIDTGVFFNFLDVKVFDVFELGKRSLLEFLGKILRGVSGEELVVVGKITVFFVVDG